MITGSDPSERDDRGSVYDPAFLVRFFAKVSPDPVTGCHLWTGGKIPRGYGAIKAPGTRNNKMAHRVAYEIAKGPIPPGLEIDHLCRTRLCVNPDHLEAVTHAENVRRGEAPTARNARKTHCPQGHPYDSENTYAVKSGGRMCRACMSLYRKRRLETNGDAVRAQRRAYKAKLRLAAGMVPRVFREPRKPKGGEKR